MVGGILKDIADVVHIYALIFILMCGNAFVFGLDLFLILFVFYTLILLHGGAVSKSRSSWLALLVFIFILYLVSCKAIGLELPYFDYYYLWPIKASLCLFVLNISNRLLTRQISEGVFPLLSIAGIVFLVLVNVAGYMVDGRLSFVFGPNMLYRFVVAVTLIPLVMFIVIKNRSVLYCAILVFLLALNILTLSRIGSKGGVVVFLSALYILLVFKYGWRWYIFSIFFAASAIFSLRDYSLLDIRFINFQGLQESIRYTFLMDFIQNISDVPLLGYNWLDFSVHSTPGFQYPHNSILELIFYFGVFGVVLTLVVLAALYAAMVFMKRAYIEGVMQFQIVLVCLFIVLFISSLFSGDMSDNFVFISLAMHGVFLWKSY